MAEIITFPRLRNKSRTQALRWLSGNYPNGFPAMKSDFSDEQFHGWRFIRAIDGIVYFADCIHGGITEEELFDYLQEVVNA